jgi:hypothetical protein
MDAESDDRYLRYVVARLAAYRNVWWSMANEYDFMRDKTMADWDRYFHVVRDCDPYDCLRGVHNGHTWYDHTKPWVTHASVQSSDLAQGVDLRAKYKKPVVFDEVCYEGNIDRNWGNISARELVHRFWTGAAAGCYVGHGETYLHPEDILWWSKGGVLHGESPPRIAFLRQVLEEGPAEGLTAVPRGHPDWRKRRGMAYREGEYYLLYLSVHQPACWTLDLPEDVRFRVDVLDTWEMTVTPVPGVHSGRFEIPLPAKPYVAVRAVRAE